MSLNDKSILIIMPSLTSGGAERALINYLNELKKEYSNIDLLLFQQTGLFYDLIPKEVNLIKTPFEMELLYGPIKNIIRLSKKGNLVAIKIGIIRVLVKCIKKLIINKPEMAKNQYIWKYFKPILSPIDKQYDIAIAYQQTHPINFIVDKVNASIKIGWMHSSYKGNKFNKRLDIPYFQALDSLYTVSDQCLNELKNIFENEKVNLKLMKNITSSSITDMSKLDTDIIFDEKKFNIVTVGRLVEVKGYDLMLEAVDILAKSKKLDFCLYVIGEGALKNNIVNFINEKKLNNNVKLLGVKSNPYSIINKCDLYIQTSRYEGFGLAIEEARILKRPLLVTNFSCSNLHVQKGKNGMIVSHDPNEISKGILAIYKDIKIYKKNCEEMDYEGNFSNDIKVFIRDIEGKSS